MLSKEIRVHTPLRKMRHIVIVLAVCLCAPLPSGADNPGAGIVDSQTFLQGNMTPAGPAASKYTAAVDKLLAQMTLKEKVGQMTQLEIGMITDGHGKDLAINAEKLHKAVGEYGAGSIINVNDEALSEQKWHEILHAIADSTGWTRFMARIMSRAARCFLNR
jgi:hypothetical protein